MTPIPDHATCYRAVSSRDRRFDGVFYTAVATTGIYCRPSCPARTPAERNVSFYPTAAAAQSAGYRACKRCLPDATPGSPQWDVQATTAGRAMRLISDGVVDREGVGGLASRLGYTPRHLTRVLTTELGAGPLALARARRAQTARTLIDATGLSFAEIAFAAGFDSVRQFNDTIRAVYGTTPTQLRDRPGRRVRTPGAIRLRLAVRTPFHGSSLLRFLGPRALPGVEVVGDGWYARTLRLPHAPGVLRIDLPDLPDVGTATIPLELELGDLRDIAAAVERARRLIDADCDPVAVASVLGHDPVLGPVLSRRPGLRVPGHADGAEVAVRAIVGQQISVSGARTVLGRLVRQHGERLGATPEQITNPNHPAQTGQSRPGADTLHAGGPNHPVCAEGSGGKQEEGRRTPRSAETGQIRAGACNAHTEDLNHPVCAEGGGGKREDRRTIPPSAETGQIRASAGKAHPDDLNHPVSVGVVARDVAAGSGSLTHLFPSPDALAALDPADLPMPKARARALVGLCQALVDGDLALDRGPDRQRTRERLLALPGIGDWTAGYIAIRALGDPDAFLPTDLGTRHALTRLGQDPAQATSLAENWRPWRSYAQALLWTVLLDEAAHQSTSLRQQPTSFPQGGANVPTTDRRPHPVTTKDADSAFILEGSTDVARD